MKWIKLEFSTDFHNAMHLCKFKGKLQFKGRIWSHKVLMQPYKHKLLFYTMNNKWRSRINQLNEKGKTMFIQKVNRRNPKIRELLQEKNWQTPGESTQDKYTWGAAV